VDLSRANVEVLSDLPHSWPNGPGRPDIAEFTYRQLRRTMGVEKRLAILHRAAPGAAPEPYEHRVVVSIGLAGPSSWLIRRGPAADLVEGTLLSSGWANRGRIAWRESR
jgi:hypothetical protein